MVLGHEALGQVVETGSAVTRLHAGDFVVPMVRRGCQPPCRSCGRRRRDLCLTGNYLERGIFGAHGYFTEYALDTEEDLVPVAAELAKFAVLLEPLSVVEKAVELALRLHDPDARSALVLGAGTVGILCALVLQARGLQVAVHSLEPAGSPRVRSLIEAGVDYQERISGEFDLILEAAGSDEAVGEALPHLAPSGVLIVLGAKQSADAFPFLQLILRNQVVAGSVNAGPEHFEAAARDLRVLPSSVLGGLVERVGFQEFPRSILGAPFSRPKVVHVME
jgi:threonine dehydrogenase-like Zn-dependent dehydrogenase